MCVAVRVQWVYYRSMRLVQGLPQDTHRSRVHVLFVHVPHFDKVGEEAQKRFLVSLLQVRYVDAAACIQHQS